MTLSSLSYFLSEFIMCVKGKLINTNTLLQDSYKPLHLNQTHGRKQILFSLSFLLFYFFLFLLFSILKKKIIRTLNAVIHPITSSPVSSANMHIFSTGHLLDSCRTNKFCVKLIDHETVNSLRNRLTCRY